MTHKPDTAVATDSGKSFDPHPEGQFSAQCVDCINLGEKVEEYAGQSKSLRAKVALVFRTGEAREDGELYEISKEFTLSTNEKGNLRKFLTSWRGRSFTDQEAERFEVHTLVGVAALITVEHKKSRNDRKYGNIVSITRLPKGLEPPDVGEYERPEFWASRKKEYADEAAKFRAETQAPQGEPLNDFPEALDEGDDDLPF
jgi:hypothetical protein